MRAAKTELAAAERRWAKAQQDQPLRTSRAEYCNQGQVESLRLRPVLGDVVEVFGVGGDLLEDAPGGLDVGQVLLTLIFARRWCIRPCPRQMGSKAR